MLPKKITMTINNTYRQLDKLELLKSGKELRRERRKLERKKIEIMENWKLFGLTIGSITIIPCYYDILRYQRNIKTFAIKNLNIIRFQIMWYQFRQLFDTSLK